MSAERRSATFWRRVKLQLRAGEMREALKAFEPAPLRRVYRAEKRD
jgi:hypothetical protein